MGLESLDENSPSIECELVFTQRQLQFRPPLEELRQHYYKEMRKFIGIPNSFAGFGNQSLYRRMSTMNGAALPVIGTPNGTAFKFNLILA